MRYELGFANRLGNRAVNQDRMAVVESDTGVLLVVADGMGSLAKGEIAAETFVELARERYLAAPRPVADSGAFLRELVYATHDRLVRDLAPEQSRSRFGTTAVACLVQNGEAHWAHVGDSRLYLIRGGRVAYRTRDHSFVETLFRQGLISDRERTRHPRRHQITQCIGCTRERPEVALGNPVRLREGDVLLLCSDGLWDPLGDSQMTVLLGRAETLEQAAESLAERAEHSAYPRSDNVTVVTLRLLEHGEPHRPARRGRTRPSEQQLASAIDRIHEAIEQYEKEMKD